ncbi:hypothetical protein [Amedibacillus sp. YH-ame10]
MKKKLVLIFTLVVTLLYSNIGINAMENSPAFLIADDYIIIEYEKYNLIDNKVIYNGIEFELKDHNLVTYDDNGDVIILLLPIEENRIKDEVMVQELNRQVGASNNDIAVLSVPAVNLPYSRTVPAGQWNAETPYFNVNAPGQPRTGLTHITITNIPSSKKIFTITGIWGDVAGDWFSMPVIREQDFGKKNKVSYANVSTMRYSKFFIGCLYGTPGFTYKVVSNNSVL